ncbi:MAG: penicillin-binding protein [Clostridiales bacterium]|nr:penicillin-binding protein [Clostridiales bacterium]
MRNDWPFPPEDGKQSGRPGDNHSGSSFGEDAYSGDQPADQAFDLSSFASRSSSQRERERRRKAAGRRAGKAGADPQDDFPDDLSHTTVLPDTAALSLQDEEEGEPGKKKKKTKKKRTVWGRVGQVFLSLFLVLVITGCVVVGAFAVYVFGFVDDTIDDDLNDLKLNFTTTVYVKDKESGEYKEYQRLHGGDNRIWVGIDKMPKQLQNAFVAIEDKRFFEHNGVDWKRTLAAFANMFVDLYSSNQGGSTITQQLVKNLTGDNSQHPMRKVREIMRARYVEDSYAKETILECYLNTIAMANGIYGVEVAANYYFDKSVSELSLTECAALAAMTKEPERYRPDKHPENNEKRRKTVLAEMLDQGLISQAEHDAAAAAPLEVVASRTNTNEVAVNSYFIDTVISDVVDRLAEQYDYDGTYAAKRFYNGGFKIYCTMDPDIQAKLEEVYLNDKNFENVKSSKSKGTLPQSAMTIMDYEGHIVGIVGGRGEKTTNRGLNRATDSPRQPGSTMKPIGAYAPALEYNLITYSTYIKDEPIETKIDGVLRKWPKNASGSYSGGNTTVQNAVQRSLNTVAVRTVQQLTPDKSYAFLTERLGLSHLVGSGASNDVNMSSMALGGCVYGATATEMAAAYVPFGNLGRYYAPTTFVKVTDQHDEIILEPKEPKIAMGEDTANIMNHILQTVITSGTGTAAKFGQLPLMGKTGTTSESVDRWFVGGSPYYVAACWFGFDNPETLRTSGNPALNVWKKVMEPIHKDMEFKEFPDTENVAYRRYCTATGLVATVNCSSTSTGWFKTGYLPSCTSHKGKLADELDKPVQNSIKSNTGDGESGGASSQAETSSQAEQTTSEEPASSEPATSYSPSSAPPSSSAPPDSSAPSTSKPNQTSKPDTSTSKPDTSSKPDDSNASDETDE